jgi:hypothetical protein
MKRRSALTLPFYIAAFPAFPRRARAALIPPSFLDCVVALGFSGPGNQNGVPVPQMLHTIGTGFYYGYLFKDDPDIAKREYAIYLVTARHVVDGYNKIQSASPGVGPLKVRINPAATSTKSTEFDLVQNLADPNSLWVTDPEGKDVTVISINASFLQTNKYRLERLGNMRHQTG